MKLLKASIGERARRLRSKPIDFSVKVTVPSANSSFDLTATHVSRPFQKKTHKKAESPANESPKILLIPQAMSDGQQDLHISVAAGGNSLQQVLEPTTNLGPLEEPQQAIYPQDVAALLQDKVQRRAGAYFVPYSQA